jgi:YfiH family protein
LGVPFEGYTLGHQVHGDRVAAVTAAEAGRGRLSYADALPDTDGLVTDLPEVVLSVFLADCAGVILADPVKRVIGVCHAGWKGTALGIAVKTVRLMTEQYGCRPEDLLAGISPCASGCCYEIGPETEEAIRRGGFCNEALPFVRDGRTYFDIPAALTRQLAGTGIPMNRIEASGLCTLCGSEGFFSHRRSGGITGRFSVFAVIW